MADVLLKENERIDDLQIKNLKIIQDKSGFCFGIDAVLLANFAKIKKDAKVVDLGTGTGIIPILLAGKSKAKEIIGVEIQKQVADMAQRSVKLNNLEDKIKIINEDLKNLEGKLQTHGFHVVLSNPPYMHPDGLKNPNDKKAISRHEIMCNLEDVIKAASRLLMPHGKFFMIHRPTRLADIIVLSRKYRLEPKEIRFIHPKANKAPNIMLVHFAKDSKPELKILDPIYVYDEEGNYTDQIKEIYSKEDIGEN
ncbi:tRNA1Val (adenine37-N6)-methyltransferase [Alkalithermobacter thermoalcaliphilus JW-YL-7 = DSM 7308]|uniref:Methyltransferase n=1 Tax=Alkalithermobacter thermoalcaliphilus JW-YL-7 = DSM 7308 TaxID=1121328 RepID=A0A150FSQ3_CLOPD|nr:methyltransferase [[Clostridium] paradoxum JW-YL-7 = DSM 7308]SHL19978.1 tRNA1Val (adenine37-N6)-methyltransferase [[Clostridium] paradoxum JW-YL-7 = DSM 7308]